MPHMLTMVRTASGSNFCTIRVPMDAGDLQQLALVVFFIPATSANTPPALVVTHCNLRWRSFS